MIQQKVNGIMITQWRQFEVGAFSCQVPPDWTLERADAQHDAGMILVHDAERSIALVFTTRPQPTKGLADSAGRHTQEAQQQLHQWVERLAHVRLYESPHPVPSQGQVICTTEGLEHVRAGVPWWKRLLRLGPRMLWRFWAILNSEVLVLASCNGKPEAIERHRETVNRIIQSIHLPDKPPSPPETLTPASGAESRRPVPGDAALRWSEIRAQVLPLLVPTAKLAQYGPDLVEQSWVNDMSIIYVTDSDEPRAVTIPQCTRWRLSLDALHERALANLVACSQELTMEGGKAEGYTMLAFAKPEAFNAMRILLPDLHHKLREYLGPTFYVAIPNRTFLLAFATDQTEILTRVRQQIRTDYARLPNPVSPRLFLMTADGVAGDEEVE